MIRRLLIANRGEIAVRVIHACRELGIESVAVYSEADTSAPHVLAADHLVDIGPAAPTESYLAIDVIMDAVKRSGADAVHPGYGFLSENPRFAAACEAAGVTFVGPPAAVIAAMGSKINAREIMRRAGVPVVPGETPLDQTDEGIQDAVERVGFPALIKAAAGGGGKGMRIVADASETVAAVQAARREALAAFGDGTVYVERVIQRPRHVEVQVFADAHGHVVHLFERECSVQRRHQKVIEESPSPVLTSKLRARITEAGVAATAAASYRNAGTVEFLLDAEGGVTDDAPFYFLEMNTRLQVEHPVTEMVTGLDLVRAQLLVAAGEPLPWSQESIHQRGHAIEVRVYAEDPDSGFLPQAGTLQLYREPRAPGIRVDSGVRENQEVTVHYDPLLAKVIAYGEHRDAAIRRLTAALRDYPILGIRTNIDYLLRVLQHSAFQRGDIDTGFLAREAAALSPPVEELPPEFVRAAMAVHAEMPVRRGHDRGVWDPWRILGKKQA